MSASDLTRPPVQPTSLLYSSGTSYLPNAPVIKYVEDDATGFHQPQDNAQRPDQVSPSEHSVHAIIGAALDENDREGFFGSSSAETFMQLVKKTVQQKVGGMRGQPAASQHLHPQTLPALGHEIVRPKPADYALPTRRRADILMACYWKSVHVLYPYLDKMQMEDDYEKLWKSEVSITDERSFMCLLNVIFALSSQIDHSLPIETRQQSAYVFYVRAKELLDIVETGQIRSVQTFLLLGQYYQSTSEPHPCWIFIGLAIRTAQSIGLHLAETSERVADIKARELLRKVWHGCVLMDRVVSITYGRPCMVGPKAALTVPLPLPIDEEYLLPEALQGQPVRTQETFAVEFYVLSLKLYEIMHETMFNFYSVDVQPQEDDKYFGALDQGQRSVFEIDRRLTRWANSIPHRLRVTTGNKPQSNTAEATLYRQAVILHQRQLYVRMLLLRPVLSTCITSELPDGDQSTALDSLLSQRMHPQCAIVCVKVALEAINTIHNEIDGDAGGMEFCAAWWYNAHALYTSATILIAARLAPAILADVSEELVLDGWDKAMESLERYSPLGASIKRMSTTLRLLFDAVPQQYSLFKEHSRQTQGNVPSLSESPPQASALLPECRPQDVVEAFPTPQDNLNRGFQEEADAFPYDSFWDFNTVFDPNDLSWLINIPLDT